MNKPMKASFIVIGALSVICAALGLFYNASSFLAVYSGASQDLIKERNLSYFYPAFYIMSGICVLFYAALLFCGINFIRLRPRCVSLFIAVMVIEILYFFSIGFFGWESAKLGQSIAAATGVANGGLMYQFITLFPLWASIAVLWAKRKINQK